MKVVTEKIESRENWLKMRQSGIGGSDIAAVLGLSPWKSPVDVWMEKTGRASNNEETEAMYWGNQLEDVVAKEYAKRTGYKVWRVNHLLRHSEAPCLIASVDRLVSTEGKSRVMVGDEIRTDTGLECKTSSQYAANEWGEDNSDKVPEFYLTQCLHYMGITGCKYWDLACLFCGREFRKYHIMRNEGVIAAIQEAAMKFWKDHVEADVAPAPRSIADVNALFKRSSDRRITASQEVEDAIKKMVEVKEKIKELESQKESLQEKVCVYMKDSDTLDLPDGKVLATWKSTEDGVKTDWKGLAIACKPSGVLVEEFTSKVAGSRRFLLK